MIILSILICVCVVGYLVSASKRVTLSNQAVHHLVTVYGLSVEQARAIVIDVDRRTNCKLLSKDMFCFLDICAKYAEYTIKSE